MKWLTVNKLQDKQQNCDRVTMRVSRDIGQQVSARARSLRACMGNAPDTSTPIYV